MYNPIIDPLFESFFRGRLRQIFFYITDRCQLRCEQCLYKTTLANRDIPEDVAIGLTDIFVSYGAKKLTFIGGEPTLYDRKNNCKGLLRIAEFAKRKGVEYVRIDTNGLFNHTLLDDPLMDNIDNLAFSFDGPDAESHEVLRGKGTFDRSMTGLIKACRAGINVTVTVCVHPGNLHRLSDTIHLFAGIGVKEVNFHPLFKMGIERDKFTGSTNIDVEDWKNVYFKLKEQVLSGMYEVPVRVSRRFVPIEEYRVDRLKYRYCPTRMGERILVHPDGALRICALGIGSKHVVGEWNRDELAFDRSANSEVATSRLGRGNCLSQIADFGSNVPLCISHKEGQTEHVWRSNGFGATLQSRDRLSDYWDDGDLHEFWGSSSGIPQALK